MLDPKDEIKQRLDIVEVISEYLPLKPAGSGSFKACCPFHGEKTPSFHVSREKQIWHCFGCNKGGDLISFVMELEGLSFPAALEMLALKAGVTLPEREQTQDQKKSKEEREILLDVHIIAQKFYAMILKEHDRAKDARVYLEHRGITVDLIEKFGLGFAPDEWSMLTTYLQKRGYHDAIILKSGLSKTRQSGSGLIDRFRNRILVPLHDPRGRVIGFTGRSLIETETSGPKYLNSPETEIYNKRTVLYGLHLAKTAIRREKGVIIVEGNLDVIASHKAGVEHIVASSGTALTESQLQTLKKLTQDLIFCFDADNAGYEAAKRGMDLAQQMGLNIKVIQIPKELGKDPDDVVQKNPQAWQELVKRPIHAMQYYLSKEFDRIDLSDPTAKDRAAQFVLQKLALIPSAIEQEHWLMQLADLTRVSVDVLRAELKKKPAEKQQASGPAVLRRQETDKHTHPHTAASRFLLGILLCNDAYAMELFAHLGENLIDDEQLKRIYTEAREVYTQANTSASAQNTIFSTLSSLYQSPERLSDAQCINAIVIETEQIIEGLQEKHVREEISRHIHILNQAPRKRHLLELERAIRQAEMSGDKERARELTDAYMEALKS